MARVAVFIASAGLLLSGCAALTSAHWEHTRQSVIEPMNSAFHRELPRSIRQRDLAAILRLYAVDEGTGLSWDWAAAQAVSGDFDEEVLRWRGPGRPERIRSRYERILDLFQTVDSAEARIEWVDWDHAGADGYAARIHLIVRGVAGETRRQLDQWASVRVAARAGGWQITAEEITARELVASLQPRYTLATERAGLDNVHDTDGSPTFRIIGGSFNSSGSAVGDVNGDGLDDVVLASASRLALYLAHGAGTFRDASTDAGLPNRYPEVATGVILFDYDNDGYADLYVAAITGDRLFHNDRGRGFVDVSQRAGITPGSWGSMPLAADYDRDGDLDIFVVRMGDHQSTPPQPNYDARNGFADALYRNNGDGTFTDVAPEAGVADTGWGLAGAWGDYDADGWPDLYVGNEFGTGRLYRNRRDGTFADVTEATGTATRSATMGVAWGDYDGDGHLDLYISAMHANSRWVLFHPDFPQPIPWYLRLLGAVDGHVRQRIHQYSDELTRGSTLLRNNGDGTFTDISDTARVRDTQWGWAAEFLDYNNDGHLDLYAVNGFISGPLLDDL
jgi:hypothetical protein